jgi:putative acetyltransferase
MDAVRELFQAYAQSLKIDLCFQNFSQELQALPGEYCPPRGALVAAMVLGHMAGCCAMRPLDTVNYPDACEMKRLFIRPSYRGLGLGRLLVEGILDCAHQAGYESTLLDTLNAMEAARTRYHDLGFEEIPPYYFNPIAGPPYLKADL